MARLPRLYAPSIPQLAQARFARPLAHASEPTPVAQLDLLKEWLAIECRKHGIALHGWAILLDRIVLLATPQGVHATSRVMQGLGRRMAVSMVHGRVFQERYRAALVDESWIPASLAWIDSLSVRAGLVDTPTRWPWSSAQEHVGLRPDTGLLTEHFAYWNMGNTPFARQAHYQELLLSGLAASDAVRIETAIKGQWALGDEDFCARLSMLGSRRAAPGTRGRPKKAPSTQSVTN